MFSSEAETLEKKKKHFIQKFPLENRLLNMQVNLWKQVLLWTKMKAEIPQVCYLQ